MERVLTKLFDYQKFEKNADLGRLIDSVHSRYAIRELSMDDMELINAAGVPHVPVKDSEEDLKWA